MLSDALCLHEPWQLVTPMSTEWRIYSSFLVQAFREAIQSAGLIWGVGTFQYQRQLHRIWSKT